MSRISGAAVPTDGKLRILQFGTEFSINFTSKSESVVDLENIEKQALISVGPRSNLFYALFDEEDVDFCVLINNSECSYRSVVVDLGLHNKCYGFVQPEQTQGRLETVETHGRKFHFVSQSSKEGKSLTSAAAAKYEVSYREASKLISRINFHIEYSPELKIPVVVMNIITCEEEDKKVRIFVQPSEKVEELKEKIGLLYQVDPIRFLLYFNGVILRDGKTLESYHVQENSRIYFIFRGQRIRESNADYILDSDAAFPIYIQTLSGKREKLYVLYSDTISKLKERIEDKMGYRKDVQKILFGGKQLEDWKTIRSFDIDERTILFLCTKLVGGAVAPGQSQSRHFVSSTSQQVIRRILLESDSDSETGSSESESQSHRGEKMKKRSPFESQSQRGAICLGGRSKQIFNSASFTPDSSIHIQDFTIELRKSPKYGLL